MVRSASGNAKTRKKHCRAVRRLQKARDDAAAAEHSQLLSLGKRRTHKGASTSGVYLGKVAA